MSVQVEKLEKNMVKLTIEVPAEEVEKALNAAYQKQKNSISVPGFRKGKVPRAMIEKMYGVEYFYTIHFFDHSAWHFTFTEAWNANAIFLFLVSCI